MRVRHGRKARGKAAAMVGEEGRSEGGGREEEGTTGRRDSGQARRTHKRKARVSGRQVGGPGAGARMNPMACRGGDRLVCWLDIGGSMAADWRQHSAANKPALSALPALPALRRRVWATAQSAGACRPRPPPAQPTRALATGPPGQPRRLAASPARPAAVAALLLSLSPCFTSPCCCFWLPHRACQASPS